MIVHAERFPALLRRFGLFSHRYATPKDSKIPSQRRQGRTSGVARRAKSNRWSKIMTKLLSEQLADLSVRAKHAEDAFSAAQTEAHDKFEVRKQKARADATAAVEKVNQNIKS